MNPQLLTLFWPYCIFVILLFIIGLYCILATYNLIRILIGIELLIKAVTLLLIVVGYINGHTALMQALVITLVLIEVVSMVIAAGIIIGLYRHNNSLDTRNLRTLKG